jgi:hypothetical protein
LPENNAGTITEVLKWGWTLLIGAVAYMWKNLSSKVEANSKAMTDHALDDLRMHENYVSKTDWSELKLSIYSRFDKLDAKSDTILNRVMEGITRTEFKNELKSVYLKLDDLQKTKVDK